MTLVDFLMSSSFSDSCFSSKVVRHRPKVTRDFQFGGGRVSSMCGTDADVPLRVC